MILSCPECATANSGSAMFCKQCGCGFEGAAAESMAIPPTSLAPYARRCLAALLDIVVLTAIYILLTIATGVLSQLFSAVDAFFGTSTPAIEVGDPLFISHMAALGSFALFAFVGSIGIGWLYHALCIASPLRATPGKLLCQLEVVSSTGDRLSFLGATMRYFIQLSHTIICAVVFLFSSFVGAIFWGLYYAGPLVARQRRAIHDIGAGSLVVQKSESSNGSQNFG